MKRVVKGQANITPPWQPVEVLPADIVAIKALCAGEATDQQQARIVGWLKRATGVAESSYHPDSERDSAFAAGKRFVGLQFFSLAQSVLPAQPEKP